MTSGYSLFLFIPFNETIQTFYYKNIVFDIQGIPLNSLEVLHNSQYIQFIATLKSKKL